jgi:DNA helicase-2/ATP-dependent DNA helicase PcrA
VLFEGILSTIHASKGLEYDVVFLVGCEEDLLPHYKSKTSDLDVEEERRLMYVAITRPKRYLYISFANLRKGEFNQKSRFLKEIEKSMRRN